MKLSHKVISAVMLSTASAGLAASEQASSSMLCAVTNTVSCDPRGDCIVGSADAVNMPTFMNFDLDKKVVESARQGGDRRTSKIVSISNQGDVLVLLGDEGTNGWSATIHKSSGNFTGSVATDGIGYLIFGSCLPH